MPHAEVDDNFADHGKVWRLSDAAFRLHTSGILYCARLITDGFVPANKVQKLVPKFRVKALDELVSAGMWTAVGIDQVVSYEIHDYLDWNPSRAQIEERRKKAAQRKAKWLRGRGNTSDDEE